MKKYTWNGTRCTLRVFKKHDNYYNWHDKRNIRAFAYSYYSHAFDTWASTARPRQQGAIPLRDIGSRG